MHRGYIKTYRALEEWALYKDSGAVHLLFHLMINATHKPRKIKFNGKPYILQPGQLTRGRKQLANETGIKESQIRKLLQEFEDFGEIKRISTTTCTLITLEKWGQFQVDEKITPTKKPTTRQRATNDSPLNKNEKNEKNEKIKKTKKTPHSFEDSEFYLIDRWIEALRAKGWSESDAKDYHSRAENYSNKGNKYINWIKAVCLWKTNKNKEKKVPSYGKIKFDN